MTLSEKWFSLLDEASSRYEAQFIFAFKGDYYYSEWMDRSYWADPVKIKLMEANENG